MGMEIRRLELQDDVVDTISQRLSLLSELYLPYALSSRGDSVTHIEKRCHLADLLRRDAAVFLERYGSNLSNSELQEFEVFKEDYEVSWHLKQLNFLKNPTEKERRAQATAVKNRRLAFMDRLMQDGHYFSEDSMRMRAPLLHHVYVGKFQDPTSRAFCRPGERFSEMLIRQAEEVEFEARLKEEREKAGMVGIEEDEEVGVEEEEEEEEEEEDDDDDDDMGEKGKEVIKSKEAMQQLETENRETTYLEQAAIFEVISTVSEEIDIEGTVEVPANQESHTFATTEEERQSKLDDFTRIMQEKFLSGEDTEHIDSKVAHDQESHTLAITDEEMQSKLDDFTRIMQEKFLSGEDTEHMDYSTIDHDTALDDHWLKEISQDAEEKYFDED